MSDLLSRHSFYQIHSIISNYLASIDNDWIIHNHNFWWMEILIFVVNGGEQ